MQSMDLNVLERARHWLTQRQPVWLCTVIHTYGSAPRSPGSLLAATATGEFVGSLSGGCIEEDFLRRISQHEFSQPSQLIRYGEGGVAASVTLPCGGAIDVLVESLPVGEESASYIDTMLAATEGRITRLKRLTLPCAASLQPGATLENLPRIQQQGASLTLRLDAVSQLIIAGLSSVALYCIDFASSLGFEIIVCEHREAERRQFIATGAVASNVTLVNRFPARYLEEVGCHPHTAIIALTHDPRIDDLTMMEAVNTPAFYLGVMGSTKNSINRLERLRTIGGLTAPQLARIHAPVGLAIGSKTPAEIALAIMADIVQKRNLRSEGELAQESKMATN